jgi:hypothetical protein
MRAAPPSGVLASPNPPPCGVSLLLLPLAPQYYNRQDVRDALHAAPVRQMEWQPCSDGASAIHPYIAYIVYHVYIPHPTPPSAKAALRVNLLRSGLCHARMCADATHLGRFAVGVRLRLATHRALPTCNCFNM